MKTVTNLYRGFSWRISYPSTLDFDSSEGTKIRYFYSNHRSFSHLQSFSNYRWSTVHARRMYTGARTRQFANASAKEIEFASK